MAKDLSAQDRHIIHTSLKLYSKNARAAAGTMKGLGKQLAADDLTKEADDVDGRLAPLFDDQGTLALATGS